MATLTVHELDKNIEIITVENVFNDNEYKAIWEEVLFLINNVKLFTPSSYRDDGVALTNNKPMAKNKESIFLDDYYTDRRLSAYLTLYKKIVYELKNNKDENFKLSLTWNGLFNSTADFTLFAKYSNKSCYLDHHDTSIFTQLFWISKEPKKFTGGDLYFKQYDATIFYKPNTMIIFPGWLKHSITKVNSVGKRLSKNDSRFSFSTFFTC